MGDVSRNYDNNKRIYCVQTMWDTHIPQSMMITMQRNKNNVLQSRKFPMQIEAVRPNDEEDNY